jgi:hypothetical protein
LNYSGKFDATLSADGVGSLSHVHLDSIPTQAPADSIIVPDAHLLFYGDFKRSGIDLILSEDGRELVLHDYFKGEKRAALASPDGAHLNGHTIDALTGHVHVAQAGGGPAAAGQVIGHVTKLQGSATVIRNGVSVILNNGDNVEKGDVVQTGANSSLGITFIDGTVFGLLQNARMVLNEMVYDPNGSNNSSLLTLVAGTISFVAGETAKHGDMKVDTPVATMGIRGTAVLAQLLEIDFSVPAAPSPGQSPTASFQVLVEPDGTTGSYILFDKVTLQPIAVVNQAGVQVNISNGVVTTGPSQLSPDIQKLIIDIFTLKFTQNDQTTKVTSLQTDSINPLLTTIFFKTDSGITGSATFGNLIGSGTSPGTTPQNGPSLTIFHVPQAPFAVAIGDKATEIDLKSGLTTTDVAGGTVAYTDINAGDRPSVSAAFTSFSYKDAQGNAIASTSDQHSLNALQKLGIAATEVALAITQDPAQKNNGTANWSYSLPDHAFDFLAKGETLTLTYTATVDNGFTADPSTEFTKQDFTITITGTNDVPVITTDKLTQLVNFAAAGTQTSGGMLSPTTSTSGTFDFTDPDLTDKHTVSVELTSASLLVNGHLLDKTGLEALAPGPMATFEQALSVAIANDSTGSGNGTISWNLADLPVYLADFIPTGKTLTLIYTVTLTDSHGATDTKTVEITIGGNNNPAEVWIHTTDDNSPNNLWTTGQNWETGRIPIATDDVIIITDQLQGLIPSYPVTIDAGTQAVANSVTMNDFSSYLGDPPELKILSGGSLTVGTTLSLSADSKLDNAGTVDVGTQLELLDTLDQDGNLIALNQSAINNSGTLNLDTSKAVQAGDIQGNASVTNTGTIDLKGGTLNVLVGIANSQDDSSGNIIVDTGATLILGTDANNLGVHGGITGGTVTINGELDLTGGNFLADGTLINNNLVNVTGTGNSFDGEQVTNDGAIDVIGALTLKKNASITNGSATNAVTVGNAGSLTLSDTSSITDGKLVNLGNVYVENATGAVLDDVNVDNTSGTVHVDIIGGPATLILDNGTTITGGTLDIGDVGTLEISQPVGATLSGVTVAVTVDPLGSGVVQVDDGATLVLSQTTITNGTINDFSGGLGGTIHVTGASGIVDASLKNGFVTVDAKLTLDGATVSGTTITDDATIELDNTVRLSGGATVQGQSSLQLGAITNLGLLEVLGAATLLNDSLTNTGHTVQVDDSQTLAINGTTITGGTINDYSGATGGTVHVAGASRIVNASLNNGFVTVDAALTLDGTTVSGTLITDDSTGSIELDNTVRLTGNAEIQGTSSSVLGAITNLSTLEVSGAATLLNDSLINAGHTIQVDDGKTLTINGTTITGGTINDNNGVAGGTIHVTGASRIVNAGLNNGFVTVDAALTLDGTTVSGTVITDDSAGSIELDHTVKLTGNAEIQGTSSSVLGAITNLGTLEVSGAATLLNDSLINTGHAVQVDDGKTLTVNGTTITGGTINDYSGAAGGTIHVAGASKIVNASLNNGFVTVDAALTLDGTTVSGTTVTDNGGGIELDNTIALKGGATIQGGSQTGAITNTGTLDVAGTATLSNEVVTNTGHDVQVETGQTLNLDDSKIDAGTLTVHGEVDSTGTSFLTDVTIVNDGTIEAVSGTLTVDPAPFTNTGTIEVAGGAALVLSGETVTNDANSHTTKGIIQVDTDAKAGDGTLDLQNSAINGGILNIAGVLDSTGDSFITGVDVTNTGTFDVTGGTLTVDVTSTIANLGNLEADGGNLIIDTGVSGNLEIKGASTLELGGGENAYSQAIVTFDAGSTGTLVLDQAAHFTGTGLTVTGLDDNKIDLANIAFGSNPTVNYVGNALGGILEVFVDGNDVADINLTGDYLGVHWALADDGSTQHGTTIEEIPGAISGLDANGNAIEGSQLSASVTDGGHAISGVTFHWQVFDGANWVDAKGNNGGSTYTPVEADEGLQLRVSLSFTDANGKADSTTVSAGTVQESPTENASIQLAGLDDGGNAVEGTTVTATVTEADAPLTGVTYTWTVGGHVVKTGVDMLGNTYTPTETDEGLAISVAVSFTDAHGFAEHGSTSAGTVQESPTENASISLSGLTNGNAVKGTTVTATVTEADAPLTGITYTWTVDGHVVKTGVDAAGNTYTPTETDEGLAISVAVSFTDTHGFTEHGSTSAGTVQESPTENASIALSGLTSGNAVEGTTVTAAVTEADAPASGITYTWTVGGHVVKTGVDAPGNTYTPTEGDEGLAISVAVSFTDTHGFAEHGSTSAGTVQESPTENASTSLAGLTNGNAVEGTTVTATVTETDAPTSGITYTWTVGNTVVKTGVDALGNTYTPTEGDEGLAISVAVSFTDTHGFTEHGSTSAGTVQESPTENAAISLSGLTSGNAVEGTAVTATVTEADAPESGITYTWTVGGHVVKTGVDTAGNTYTPTETDEGQAISVAVSFTDTHGFAEHGSTSAGTVQESPTENASISLSGLTGGNAVEGTTVTATVTEADAPESGITYTWTVGGHVVKTGVDTAGNTYTPTETDEGQAISVAVSFTDTHGFAEHGSTSAGTVQESPTENASISFSGLTGGNAVEGHLLTAVVTETDAPASGITYTWKVNGTVVKTGVDTAGNTYTPTEGDEGQAISVSVSFTDTHGFAETGTKSAGTVQESPTENAAISLSGLTSGNAVEGQLLTATVTETDAPTSGITYTWKVNGTVVKTGVDTAGNTYTPTEGDEGQAISVSVSFTDTHGFAETGTKSAGTVQESPTENASISLSGLTGGNAVEGTTVTATVTEADAPTSGITYTWKVNGTVVKTGVDAAGKTYTPTEGDEGQAINVSVSFTDTHGFAETGTKSAGTVQESTTENAAISFSGLTNGNAVEGTTVTATVTETDAPATGITYTWKVNGTVVKTGVDAAGKTYTPTEADEGLAISVAVSFTDTHGFAETGTKSVGTVQEKPGGDLVAALDQTTAQQGVTIHVTQVTDGGVVVTDTQHLGYAWQSLINGTWTTVGTSSSFTPGEAQEGKLLQLVISYAEAGGTESVTYGLGMPNDLVVTLDSTTASLGFPIHVTSVKDGGDTVSDGVQYAWQTFANGQWTTVGTASSYTPASADVGERLQLVVTYTDPGETETVTTALGVVATAKEWKSNAAQPWDTAGQWSPSGVPTANDNAVIDATTGHAFTLTITQTNDVAHALVVNSSIATVEIVEGAKLTLGGNLVIDAGAFQIDSGGTLKEIASSATIAGSFKNNGTVEVGAGDSLEIANTPSGSGIFKIDAGATLTFDHGDALNVVFSGSGTLVLEDPAHFTGTVSNSGGTLTSGDVLDLIGFDTSALVTYSAANKTVTVSEPGHTPAVIHVGTNSGNWSQPLSDGYGGILIHDPPVDDSVSAATVADATPAPHIETANFAITDNGDGTTTISGLQVSDTDLSASTQTFTLAATAGDDPDTSVTPSLETGSLDQINSAINSIVYHPGANAPQADTVNVTVVDKFGQSDVVHFVFGQGTNGQDVNLQGTNGKDVIIATNGPDTLTGNGGADQFVFKPTGALVQHTITDFNASLDTIDLRQFGSTVVSASDLIAQHLSQQGNDALLTVDNLDSILLKNVQASSLHTSDFIVHS